MPWDWTFDWAHALPYIAASFVGLVILAHLVHRALR